MISADELKIAGFDDKEIASHQKRTTLKEAGFDNIEIDNYFNKPVDTDPQEKEGRTLSGTLKDVAISAGKGVVGLGEAAVGLADIPTFGRVGKGMEEYLGYDPAATQEFLGEFYSPAQKEAFRKVEAAEGFLGTAGTMLRHPSTIGHAVVESAPQMLGGAAAARKLIASGLLKMTPVWKSIIAASVGEGLVSAGSTAEGIRQQTKDGVLTLKQAAIPVISGAGTALFAVVGGRVAQKFGIIDPDIFLAGGSNVTSTGIIKRIIGGGITEGAFEELPQSMQEQVWLNAALDKPLLEDVGEAGATGTLTGFAMGAGFNIFTGRPMTEPEISPAPSKETASEAATLTNMIDEGMTTGEINGQPFTPEIATGIIQEAYVDKALTDEDLDNFREKYPDLRPIVNDIISEKVKSEINKEMEDADARGVLLGKDKDVTAKELLTGKREKALTSEGLITERARVFEEAPQGPAEISAEVFEKEITEEERVRARAEIEPLINRFMRRAKPEEAEGVASSVWKSQDIVTLADAWNKIWAAGTISVPDDMLTKAKTMAKARPDLLALVRNIEGGVEMMTPKEAEPTAEAAREPVGVEKFDLPEFEGTGEALTFGKKATPDQKKLLKQRREVSLKRFEELKDSEDFDTMMVEATKAQLDREALEAGKIIAEHPEFDPDAAEKVEKAEVEEIGKGELGERWWKIGKWTIAEMTKKTKLSKDDLEFHADIARFVQDTVPEMDREYWVNLGGTGAVSSDNGMKSSMFRDNAQAKDYFDIGMWADKDRATLISLAEKYGYKKVADAQQMLHEIGHSVDIGTESEIDKWSVKQVSNFFAAKPLTPKIEKPAKPEAVTEDFEGEGIAKIAWKYNEQHKKDFATPDQVFWDWYERYPAGAKGLKKEFGITLDKSQKGEWYLAKKTKAIPEVKPKGKVYVDEFGKTIVKEKSGLKYAVNNIQNPTFLTVWDSGKKIGGMSTADKAVHGAEGYVQIGNIEVSPKYRKQGIATELYKTLLEHLPKEAKGIMAYSPEIIAKKAIPKIYKKLGGRLDEETGHYFIDKKPVKPKVEKEKVEDERFLYEQKLDDTSIRMLEEAKEHIPDLDYKKAIETARKIAGLENEKLSVDHIAEAVQYAENDYSIIKDIAKSTKEIVDKKSVRRMPNGQIYDENVAQRIEKIFGIKPKEKVEVTPEAIPKELEAGIKKIEKLDAKRREYVTEYEQIVSTSGVGQAPPVAGVALNKAMEISKKQAKIWNDIRSYIVVGNKTLWQVAVSDKENIVKQIGKEEGLDFYGSDIREMIDRARKAIKSVVEEKLEVETTPEGKEISKLDLTKRYVKETGEKIKEGEIDKVKEKYPEEWEAIDKAEKHKKSLWDKLPEDFRHNRGINEYTTKELKDMVVWENLTLDEFEKIPLKERGRYTQLPKSVREERLETERWVKEQERKKKEAKVKRAEKKAKLEKPTGVKEPAGVRDEKVFSTKEGYVGEHEAPDRDYGAPLNDLSGFYPDDIYSLQGARYYGDGGDYQAVDNQTINIIKRYRNKPNLSVTIYRAVPKAIITQEKINDLEEQKRYILKRGKIPPGIKTYLDSSEYYDSISEEIDKLKSKKEVVEKRPTINAGDWVTINKRYAIDHGKRQFGRYRIVQKTVKASEIFTTGDSIHEWGYDPEISDKKLATKATKPQDTITRADLKSIFAKMKNISTGVDKDGNFFFRPFGKPVVTIYEVNEIEGYIDTSKGRIPVGSFLGNTIELKTGGEGHTADVGTAWHEFEHYLEKNGILSGNDIKALNGVIAKSEGISESKVTEEHRATYVGDSLSEWQGQKNLRIKRVLKKIADFVNSIWEFVTRTRTARGVLADIETGKILSEKELSAVNQFAQDISFSLKKATKAVTDSPNFVKWFGDTEHYLLAEEDGEPRIMYRGMSQKDFDIGIIDSRKKGSAVAGYFTNLPKGAQHYADRILEGDGVVKEFYVAAENVFNDRSLRDLDETEKDFIEKTTGQTIDELNDDVLPENKKFIKALKGLGYDAIETEGNYPHTEICPFESTQIKSIYNTGAYGIKEKDIMFQMAGEKAIGASTGQLVKAQEMLAEGKDKKEGWRETGWLKGAEGKWRFEIDDSGAKFDWGFLAILKAATKRKVKLNTVLKHPELYKAYPMLKDIDVYWDKDLDANAAYGERTIVLNPVMTVSKEESKDLLDITRSQILHEVQHAIQEIEGFAKGGSPEALTGLRRELANKAWTIKQKYSVEQNKYIQKRQKEIGGDSFDALVKAQKEWWDKLRENVKEAREFEKAIREYDIGIGLSGLSNFEIYDRLAGEIEARDTSARAKLTPKQRREQMPYESQGIPEDQWIVTDGEGTSFSVQETKQFATKPTKDYKAMLKKYQEAHVRKPSFQETLEPVTAEDYISNRKVSRNIKLAAVTNAKRVTSEIVGGVDRFLGSISTRLGQASPKLKAKMRRLDFDINTKYADSVKIVRPLLEKAKKMSRDDFADWDYARKNSDIAKIGELINKYNLQDEYITYRKTLDSLRKEGLDVGLEIGEIEEYAPRILKDSRGFLTAIGKAEEWPIYTRRLQERAQEIGISVAEMPLDMKADIISNMMLGGWVGLGGIPATKQRKLQKIPAYLNKYYMDSDAALMQHLHSIRKAIEARKFFGKIPKKVAEIRKRLYAAQIKIRELNDRLEDKLSQEESEKLRKKKNGYIGLEKQYTAYIQKYAVQRDYTENIGAYVIELIEKKEISPQHERMVNDILKARFHEVGTRGIIQAYKNLSYIDTMGSPISALTQIGDLAWAAYEGGLIRTLKYAYKSATKQSRITKEDVGVERIAQEFADAGTLGNAVSRVFKIVGLEKIDSIGKEALLNTALEKYQTKAKREPLKLKREIRPVFEAETDSVIDDLVNNEISENVKLLVYSRLLDFQPVGLSEMPQGYLDAGNGRLFYMLKTFTIKVFDVYRNEVYYKVKKGNKAEKIEGFKNLVRLSFYFVLANAGADELKDWVLGRTTDFSDRLVDNILRLFGVSKFVTWKARTEGVGSALLRQILPPVKFIDSAGKDIITAGDEKGLEVIGSIPVVGKLAYWHLGRGTSKREDLWDRRLRKHKAKLNKIKDDFDKAKDKATFQNKHRKELRALQKANELQGELNEYRKRINRIKSRKETKAGKLEIQRLEKQRTDKIKNHLR